MAAVMTMTSGMTDLQLLQRVASGDAAAFAEFYDRHAPRLLRILARWLADPAAAEDVLQETFWQVWRGAGRYDARRSPPGAWLFLMARSRALDYLRHRRPEPVVADRRPDGKADPALVLEHEEATRQVREALASLPREQRDALVLAFYNGLTHEQVAASQAIPLGTAKTRIRLGIRRLRVLLGG